MPRRRECTGTEAGRLRRQRDALAEFAAVALSAADPDRVLADAARLCAAGLGVPFCAVLEHRPAEGGLLVRAGVGCAPGVVGRFAVPEGGRAPGAEAFRTGGPVNVPDLRGARAADAPDLYPRHGIVSAAAVPIPGDGDRPFGALEAGARGRRGFGPHDLDFLRGFAAVLAGALRGLRRAAEARAESEAKSALLREQQHRVRNNLMAVAAMLQGGGRGAADETSRARFDAVRRRVFALASLYDHLLGAGLSGEETSLRGYLATLCAGAREFHGLATRGIALSFEASGDDPRLGVAACTALGVVVNELVANAVEHAFGPEGGRIAVGLRRDEHGRWAVTVADDGVGVPSAAEGGTGGVGLGLARRLAERAGASLALRSEPGRTVWTVLLPGDARPPRAGTAAATGPRSAGPEPRPAGGPPAPEARGKPARAMEAQAPSM